MWCGNSQKNVGVKVPVKAAKPGVMFVEQPGWAPVPQQPLNTELPCWSTCKIIAGMLDVVYAVAMAPPLLVGTSPPGRELNGALAL